jgi:hypothetical protein
MKQRQTFTLSPEVSLRAKRYARRRGLSLSSLVEQLLWEKTGTGGAPQGKGAEESSFSQRWTGKGRLTKKDDKRTRNLREKYKL